MEGIIIVYFWIVLGGIIEGPVRVDGDENEVAYCCGMIRGR